MPGRGVQGGNPAGGTNLVGAARRALGQVRVYPRAHRYGVSIAVIVKAMVKSRSRVAGAMRKPRGCAAGAAKRQPDGRVARVST